MKLTPLMHRLQLFLSLILKNGAKWAIKKYGKKALISAFGKYALSNAIKNVAKLTVKSKHLKSDKRLSKI